MALEALTNFSEEPSCHFTDCERFYYASRSLISYTISCLLLIQGSHVNESGITNRLYFNDISLAYDAPYIEIDSSQKTSRFGNVLKDVDFVGSSQKRQFLLNITFSDGLKPRHFLPYTLATKCNRNWHYHKFALVETVAGQQVFTYVDYIIFVAFLVLSCLVGVGVMFWRRLTCRGSDEQQSSSAVDEYLLAGRQMSCAPLSMSLLAGMMSAISLLGTPSEVHVYGTQYFAISVGNCLFLPICIHCIMPIFYKLQVTSIFEYIELRFCRLLRQLTVAIYVVHISLYMAMVVYTPAIALEAIGGFNMWISITATSAVCILYTTLGGLRSVVWADVLQLLFMLAGLLAVLICGSIREGGLFDRAWDAAKRGDRLEFFNMDANPLVRHTFWTLSLGGMFTAGFNYAANQVQLQRALATKSLRQAQIAYWLNVVGLVTFVVLPGLCGILTYARYEFCDPLKSGKITKRDQLIPYYIMNVLSEDFRGFPGIFMAVLFSAGLSTVSSVLNGLTAVTVSDALHLPFFKRMALSDTAKAHFSRIITVFYGLFGLVLVLIIQKLPGMLEATITLLTTLGAPIFGVFIVGIFLPIAKWRSVLTGLVIALFLNCWIAAGSVITKPRNYRTLPFSTEACQHLNHTMRVAYTPMSIDFDSMSGLQRFYSLSYMHLAVLGVAVVVLISLLTIPLFGLQNPHKTNERICSKSSLQFFKMLPINYENFEDSLLFWCKSKDEEESNVTKHSTIVNADISRNDAIQSTPL